MRHLFNVIIISFATMAPCLNSAMADKGHSHGPFMQEKPELPTHGTETADVQTGDTLIDIYGKIRLAVEYNNPGPSGDANFFLTSEASRLGFRGSKSIDKIYKIFWQVESAIDIDNLNADLGVESDHHGSTQLPGNESELALYDSFLGISGPFGNIMGGKHMTPYRIVSHNWDIFPHVPGDSNILLGYLKGFRNPYDHHGTVMPLRMPNSLVYTTSFNKKFNAIASYSILNERSQNILPTDSELGPLAGKPMAWGLNLSHNIGSITVTLAHERYRNVAIYTSHAVTPEINLAVDTVYGTNAGIMFHRNNFMATLFLERLRTKDASPLVPSGRRDAIYASGELTLDKWVLRLAGGQAGEFQEDDGGGFISLAVAYKLTEGAEVYLSYTQAENDPEANFGTFHIKPVEEGEDPSTIALGTVYNFK